MTAESHFKFKLLAHPLDGTSYTMSRAAALVTFTMLSPAALA